MRIGFIVNDVAQEHNSYTTTHLALCAHKREHVVYFIGVGDLAYYSDGQMGAHAFPLPVEKKFRTAATLLNEIKHARQVKITAADLDVLMLRNDPAEDIEKRPWAQNAGILFGQMAVNQGVMVLNDPNSLANAMNKMYFQYFPEQVRPKSIITRDVEDIKQFFEENKHKMVLKPLQGSGGRNVFLVTKSEAGNINQMFEAISRDGFVIAQEYLPDAKNGDIRLFLMNGKPIIVEDQIAALRRIQSDDDIRSNIHRGGKASKVQISDDTMKLVDMVMPKLAEDGMFFVGLDIVGDKLMEINVFSPGGLSNASKLCKVDFFTPVLEAIERKIHYKEVYKGSLDNAKIAAI
jgi:glutathione synthase